MARILVRAARATARSVALHHLPLRLDIGDARRTRVARYLVTATRQITQYATWVIEADSPDEAAVKSEDAPISEASITASYDKGGDDDGWAHGVVVEITDPRPQSVRRRLASAIGYGAPPRLPRHPQ